MDNNKRNEVRAYLANRYVDQLQSRGIKIDQVPDDFDLFLEGVIDSLGLMQLIAAIETHFGYSIDFEDLDAERVTIFGPLVEHITKKLMEAEAVNIDIGARTNEIN